MRICIIIMICGYHCYCNLLRKHELLDVLPLCDGAVCSLKSQRYFFCRRTQDYLHWFGGLNVLKRHAHKMQACWKVQSFGYLWNLQHSFCCAASIIQHNELEILWDLVDARGSLWWLEQSHGSLASSSPEWSSKIHEFADGMVEGDGAWVQILQPGQTLNLPDRKTSAEAHQTKDYHVLRWWPFGAPISPRLLSSIGSMQPVEQDLLLKLTHAYVG